MVGRSCSECGASLEDRAVTTKTCGVICRQRRSRRIARANRDIETVSEQQGAGAAEIAAIVRRSAPDEVHKLVREQLQPVVREAITEDVLRAINDMVGLAPAAVSALQEDLTSEDPVVRHRAAALVIKYTVGHPAIVRPDTDPGTGQMTVNFNLPRPGAPELEANDPEAQQPVALKECDICHEHKPLADFVAGSDRCHACFEEWKGKVLTQFAAAS